ncbi:MAG: 3-hydroxyacyl-CoA dehydrogenase NAD-binding domain-containing protein [Bacteroidetes bacterium]|nr:3-hydroxyacyl-CoA dehydrogenase NAD-binding domain-containing protein [Bacteroidota bacterium]
MEAFKLVYQNNIATLTFDVPNEKVNILKSNYMKEFSVLINELEKLPKTTVLIFKSGKPDSFIVGADVNEINTMDSQLLAFEKSRMGQEIFNKIQNLPYPTVAAINGVCVGGGLELALAFKYRVASDSDKTLLGLPEVKLGIIPALGGTQRLPRLIGLQSALPLILSGKMIDAKKALKIKLVDAIFAKEFFDEKILAFGKKLLTTEGIKEIENQRKLKPFSRKLIEKNPLGRIIIFNKAEKELKAFTKGKYPAPLAALEAVKQGFTTSLEKGLINEAKIFSKLAPSQTSKNLIHIFFLQEDLKKFTGSRDKNIKPLKIENATIIGAGFMGSGIAWLLSQYCEVPVRMKDLNQNAVTKGFKSIKEISFELIKKHKISEHESNFAMLRISGTTKNSGIEKSDFIVEAIIEEIEAKKSMLNSIEQLVKKEAIIVSNTSSLSISEMAKSLKFPERFAGMHFFSPVHKMPLVEIIPGEKTSEKTIVTLIQLSKQLKKVPIIVKNCPGFLINRVLLPYINEAIFALEEGFSIQEIDNAITYFGMPVGPLLLADEVGWDVGFKVAKILHNGYGDRMPLPSIVSKIDENKDMLGRKSNKGFYIYDQKKKKPNPAILQLVQQKNILSKKLDRQKEIIDRCILIMLNEVSLCLEDNVIDSPEKVDFAMIMGIGFPPFHGGICRYADQRGIKEIVNRLTEFESKYGIRFTPSKLLVELAKSNKTFYSM